jgi:DNA polymerase-3 subunit gamma/tau
MYTALYRSFRPETFDAVLGQEHIVKILRNQIKTETTGHAYLFCGTRGTGKTTTARLLAKGVNCSSSDHDKPCGQCAHCLSIKDGTFMDVIEIDAASNNGVENIRELRESVKYPPVAGKCKVYIIDEVHMLSTGAFNALLKTLEEPPERVMFILATTEVQKLPATILSRCLRLDFKRIPEQILKQGMREICGTIGVKISDAALGLIAANADGSVRDALSLLDQCISTGEQSVTREAVLELLGTAGEEIFVEMTDLILGHQVAEALLLLDKVIADGKDVRQFMKDWVSHFRSLLMTKFIKNPEDILNMSCENVERVRRQSEQTDLSFINDCIIKISQTLSEAKWSTQPRILLELCVVKLATGEEAYPVPREQPRRQVSIQSKTGKPVQELSGVSEEKKTENRMEVSNNNQGEGSPLKPAGLEDMDYSSLWHAVFEDGESLKSSFNLLRLGTKLKEVGNQSFIIEATSDLILKYAQENAADLERIMEKHIGRKLRMECLVCSDEGRREEEKTAEELADEIGNKFGINIEIQ